MEPEEAPVADEVEHDEWHALDPQIERYRRKQRALCAQFHFPDFRINTEDEWFLAQILHEEGSGDGVFWGLVYTHQRYGRPLYVRLYPLEEAQRTFLIGLQVNTDAVGFQIFPAANPGAIEGALSVIEAHYEKMGPVADNMIEILECAVLDMLHVQLPTPLAQQPLQARRIITAKRRLASGLVEEMDEETKQATAPDSG